MSGRIYGVCMVSINGVWANGDELFMIKNSEVHPVSRAVNAIVFPLNDAARTSRRFPLTLTSRVANTNGLVLEVLTAHSEETLRGKLKMIAISGIVRPKEERDSGVYQHTGG